jgi:hypothetical protein
MIRWTMVHKKTVQNLGRGGERGERERERERVGGNE